MSTKMLVAKNDVLSQLLHPSYISQATTWSTWRSVAEGGVNFVDSHLVQYSARETNEDFAERKKLTYSPSFAKTTVLDIKNSIQERLHDVSREGGVESYQRAILGQDNGVDLRGSSINNFIGTEVIPELLFMGAVGIFVDRSAHIGQTLADEKEAPYLYTYKREDILNWVFDPRTGFQSVLLRDWSYTFDEDTGFPKEVEEYYRMVAKTTEGVVVTTMDESKNVLEKVILDLEDIPFVLAQISDSLLVDIAYHQIALTNLASSDMAFCQKSNFPFYVENFDPISELTSSFIREGDQDDSGEEGEARVAGEKEITVGTTQGRRYGKGLDRPEFIYPSPEPMKASMAKQEQIKTEIRLLLNLTIRNLQPVRSSAESKIADEGSKQSGISTIGSALEAAERQIAKLWSQYEGSSNRSVSIKYPRDYNLRTENDRRTEAEQLFELQEKIPSQTYQKEIAKQAVRILLSSKVEDSSIQKIMKEIESAPNMSADPDVLASDIENGLVSVRTASKLRGYDEGEAEKAKTDHAERLARIADAQGRNVEDGGARGIPDQDDDPKRTAKKEKEVSQNTDQDGIVTDKTRGEGKK